MSEIAKERQPTERNQPPRSTSIDKVLVNN